MKKRKLGDEEVQKAIAIYIKEARRSAETLVEYGEEGVLGCPAMSTALSCVVAVGEVLIEDDNKKSSTELAAETFYDFMVDKASWLKPPVGTDHGDEEARQLLADIRDSLHHGLSLPPGVMLLPWQSAETELQPDDRKRWRLVVPDFIDAVDKTISKVSADPNMRCREWNAVARLRRKDRDLVERRAWNTVTVT
jgi:hypothetical protein